MHKENRIRGSLVGLALGDAIGTTLEFKPRDSYDPIDNLVGGGPFELEPGQWTDDTSMALCMTNSLIECKGFDPFDQMKRYICWYREGYCSSTGDCFDIGATVETALLSFESSGNPFSGSTDPWSAGNGSIMRLAPVPIYYNNNLMDAITYSGESSKTTHRAEESVAGCQLLGSVLWHLFNGTGKNALLEQSIQAIADLSIKLPEKITNIGQGAFHGKLRNEIRGSGYVVDSLEAALWCFYQTETYHNAVLLAANLGDDADTTAAVCGQIAGAHYGYDSIPKEWKERLYMHEMIVRLVDQLGCSSINPD